MSELRQRIQDVIDNEPVALFMKGTPQFVMCGNSDRALRALREAGAPVTTVDVLPDPAIRPIGFRYAGVSKETVRSAADAR